MSGQDSEAQSCHARVGRLPEEPWSSVHEMAMLCRVPEPCREGRDCLEGESMDTGPF